MHSHRQSRSTDSKNPGRQILLEREGTMWEGGERKELPLWLTQPEQAHLDRTSLRGRSLRRLAHVLASLLGMKTS